MKPALEPRRTQIGPYQLLAKIGEGGMGIVHLAKMDGPAGFNKLAVVKELRADHLDSPQFLQMFLDEARLAARLTHPNVVHTYGANEEHGRLFLAMEYLDGQPWSRVRRALWERSSLPLELHIKVLAEVLAGLHYAHELRDYDGSALRVVHCDMSPQNVFVTYDGQVKLVDFGVARGVTRTAELDPNVIMGKLAFIAPEQARGGEVDRRADVFSVGVMLWEAMAKRRFAEGQNAAELRERRLAGSETRARELIPKPPAALAAICDRALALDPSDRFATAAEFREALLGFLSEDMQDSDHAHLGEMISRAFADDRGRIHALIERSLKSNPPPPKSSIQDLAPVTPANDQAEHTIRADLTELASVSRIRNEVAVIEASNSASIRLRRSKRRSAAWTAGAAALLVPITWWLLRPSAEPTSTRTTAITATPLPPSVPVAPPIENPWQEPQPSATSVQLVITANPTESVLWLDGVVLPGNPYAARVRSDGALHVVRAQAPGQATQERTITLERDRVISFNLAPARNTRGRKPALPVLSVAGAPSPQPSTHVDSVSPPRPRARVVEAFDAPLRTNQYSRPIYDEDPYR